MLPKFPDISSLPVEQQIIAWIVFSVIAILASVVAAWAFNRGRKASSSDVAEKAQVAAVIVNPEALNRATAAIEALNMSQIESNLTQKVTNESIRDLREAVGELAKQIEFLRVVGAR